MHRERIYQSIWAAVIAFCITFGSLGCMVSGLGLASGGRLASLAFWCAVWCVGLSALSLLRFAPWSALIIALGLAWRWFHGPLDESVERLVYEVSSIYHEGYDWEILYWSSHPGAGSVMPALRAMAVVIAFPICQSVTRRGSAWSCMPLALLPLCSTLLLSDTMPGSGFLLTYLFGVILLMLTQGVRRKQASQGNALSARIALPLAAALGLIFLLNPQSGYNKQYLADKLDKAFASLADRFQQAQPDSTWGGDHLPSIGDTANSVDLGNVGPKDKDTQIVMTVVSSRTGRVYLRGASFADYDGTTWHMGVQDNEISQWPGFSGDAREEFLAITTAREHSVVYLPYYAPELREMEQGRVENGKSRKTYEVSYYLIDEDTLRNTAALWVGDGYTYLPQNTRDWARQKAEEILGGSVNGENPGEAVQAAQKIGRYVASSAEYSLDTPRMPEGEADFARWFLERSDTGYCTHFATAATVLLRGAGIPARYVTGYSVDARREKSVNVTASDAHAWVEYYVPGIGWTVLDPTPGYASGPQVPPVDSTPPATTPEITTPGTATTPEPTTPAVTGPTRPGETTPSASDPAPGEITAPGNSGQTTAPGEQPSPKKKADLTWMAWLLWPLAAGGLVCLQWRVRVRLRKERLMGGKGNRRAMAFWREAERRAGLLGETPPETVRLLAEKAKYSNHTLSREELAQMRGYLTACENRLRRKPWYAQILYRLVYAIY